MKCFFKTIKILVLSFIMCIMMYSCSDEPMVNGNASENISTNIVNDVDVLSQYVTNYRSSKSPQSRKIAKSKSNFVMPSLPESNDGMTIIEVPSWKYGSLDGNTNFYVPAGETTDFTGGGLNANNKCNIYIYGTLIIPNFSPSQGANIYIAPGGKLVTNAVLQNDTETALYIYNKGTYEGSYTSASKTSLYVDSDLEIANDVYFSGKVWINGTLNVEKKLTTNNCNFYAKNVFANAWQYDNNSSVLVDGSIIVENEVVINAQNVKIETNEYSVNGYMYMENNSSLYAYDNINVKEYFDVNSQGIVETPCLNVGETLYIKNNATLNISKHIHCNDFEASATGFKINMGENALFHSNNNFTIQNKDWLINFDNDKKTWSAIVATKFQIMEGEAAYIHGFVYLSATEYWGKPSEDFKYYNEDGREDGKYKTYSLQETVKATFGEVTITVDDCTPKFTTPETETPPSITEIVTSIAHTHDISATCVALANGKAYFSWHKRGTSIHGCLEAGEFQGNNFALTSWMEVDDNDVEGGNNWDGNSAASQTDEIQGQFDFNHLIVAENKVITVGDNAKMGGFIGSIALDNSGNFGMNSTLQHAFIARQLLSKVEDKIGRSGNTVAYSNGKYFIACAGGFQEYEGMISEIFTKIDGKWNATLGNYELTNGSAKHISISNDGATVATLELTSKASHADADDYWFNDTETSIGALLKVRNANEWLGTYIWEANIGEICPIYGKNTIALDNDGKVYVSAGKQGLLVYQNGNKVDSFSIADKEPKAGANGVAIDNKYVYVAYGIGGLYILDKNDLSIVSWYKSNAPEGYSTEAAAASANYVALDGEYIYVAYGRHGIKILKLND